MAKVKFEIYLDEKKVEFLDNYGGTIPAAIENIINKEERINKIRCEKVNENSFLEQSITETRNHIDKISLKDLYDKYCEFMIEFKLKPILTKQAFRRYLEDIDYDYKVLGGNKKYFRFIKLKTDEDEEWEL